MLCSRTKEYYPALKRKDILTDATTWMNLEESMLTEISQIQKNKYSMISYIRYKVEWWVPVAGQWGDGEMDGGDDSTI